MKRLAIILAPLGLIFLMGASQAPEREAYMQDVHDNLIRFGEVYRNLAFRYVDQINPEAAMTAAIRGLLDELDPYSEYYLEDAAQDLDDMSRGQYGGIGTEVGLRGADKRVTIISPFEGSPSWKAGLLPGDEIVSVNGTVVTGKALSDAVRLIKGEPGTPVTLSIRRNGSKDVQDFTLTRELINIQDVRFAEIMDQATGLGYIRLVRFSGMAGENLASAIEDLKAQGLQKLVLDLRGNPGGLLREAAAVAELFLEKGESIVVTRGRNNEVLKEIVSEREPAFRGELAVLIDGGSASASEIVAGSLQDHDRALILGQQSFGKGLVQSVLDLDDEAKVKLTTAKYYLPSGRLIQRIDYFEDNEVLEHIADSTLADTLFHTSKGRPVVSGRGVSPDVEVKADRQPWIVMELWREGLFANYMADRVDAGSLASVNADSDMLADFQQYLKKQDFEFKPRGTTQLDELDTIFTDEEAGPDVARLLEDLRESMAGDLSGQLRTHETEIARMLDLELVSLRDGQLARTRKSLETDAAYIKAGEILRSGKTDFQRALGLN